MRVHETVMRWVTAELQSGRLAIGDHLPGERALAETLQISRGSLREALAVLEAIGTIRTSTGSGPRSGTILTAAPGQALSLSINLQLASRHVEHAHVLDVRLLLETWAAEHADLEAGDWQAAEQLLDRMDEAALPLADFLVLDAEFHAALARTAGNPLISTLMDALRSRAPGPSLTGRPPPRGCAPSTAASTSGFAPTIGRARPSCCARTSAATTSRPRRARHPRPTSARNRLADRDQTQPPLDTVGLIAVSFVWFDHMV